MDIKQTGVVRALLGAATAALALAACGPQAEPPVVADPVTERTISTGTLVGYTNANGAQSWLGVPYAASTAGENRWRAPQAAQTWPGVFEALAHSEPCPQIANTLSAEATGFDAGTLFGSEDCLKLDIYTPAGASAEDADRPVMVWIHGGSNTWGYASHYDGAQLAVDQDVVVVVIQYRLGPLGFFAHPEIDEGQGANFALLDHVAALEWVRDEIAAFGGDASNVTIFGESAGGQNVAALMASPLGEGLFHRAIIQSGLFDSTPLDAARSGGEFAAEPAAARMVDTVSAETLRAAPLDAVFGAYDLGSARGSLPRVIADGVSLPADGLVSAFDSVETFNAVPVITGTNRDELRLFNAVDDRLTRRWPGGLITVRDPVFYERLADYQSRLWRVGAVDRAADRFTAAGHDAVWAYRFDWDEGGRVLIMDVGQLLGAAHGVEIPFVFNHFDFFGRLDPYLFHDRNADGRVALAGAMGAYWAQFARTGDPGAAGGSDWPAWSGEGRLMRFDAPDDGGLELLDQGDSYQRVAADLAADPAVDAAARCRIGEALIEWDAASEPAVRGALSCD